MVTVTVRELSRRETQTKVLRAADVLFQEQGFAETTIRDIAASAEVSAGSVMAVGDKRALLVTIFDRFIDDLHQNRQPMRAGGGSQVDRIMALLAPFIDLFTNRPELARSYASVLVAGEHSSMVFTELAETIITEIRTVLGEHSRDSSARARAVYLAYLGSLFAWAGGIGDPAALSEGLHKTITIICPHEVNTA